VGVVYEEISRAPSDAAIIVAPDSPAIRPGTSFLSRRVSRVVTRVDAVRLRQEVVFEDSSTGAAPPLSRTAREVAAVIESQVGNRLDYSRLYTAKVIKQAFDGALEVLADDPKVRGNGITRVPIRHGVPGMSVKVANGSRVMIFFENGDPKAPAAALWPDGSSVREVVIEASTSVTINAPEVVIDGNLSVTGVVSADDCLVGLTGMSLASHVHPETGTTTSGPQGP
jgi:hypothetical protein